MLVLVMLEIDTKTCSTYNTPVTPSEGDYWWTRVHLEDLPCKVRHHALKCLV